MKNNLCYGCTACSAVCPNNSIKIITNEKGFNEPVINHETCLKCELCEKVCPIYNIQMNVVSNNLYAFINKNNEDRMKSTSGGFFSALSDCILHDGGVVYGAAFSNDFSVVHIRATSSSERNRQRGSKYVQSVLNNTYKMVKEDLLDSKKVLFTGTPCQISGLNNYLKCTNIDTSLLVTCDFICHGTASPKIWDSYVSFIQKKTKNKVKEVLFRDKSLGWHHPLLSFVFENHQISLDEGHDPFYQLYYSNCIMKEACYSCQFTSKKRCSDITMADCWGIENTDYSLDDNKGISLVMINTSKGNNYFEIIKTDNFVKRITYNNIKQPHLNHPVVKSKKYDIFWKEFHNKRFSYILNKYGNYSFYRKFIKKIKRIILRIIYHG